MATLYFDSPTFSSNSKIDLTIKDVLGYQGINNEYKIKVLANRDEGYKNSYKKFIVDYSHMRITEDPNSQIMNEN